jgi:N-acetylmuramoyl-L-alanine amidase
LRSETKYIVIHCSATPPDMDIGVEEIRKWHKARGWRDVGYHDVIRRDGVIEEGRQVNEIGAHVKGYNKQSVGVCLVGGVDDDNSPERNFTEKQYKSLKRILRFYMALFPDAIIVGHNDLDKHKACPSFKVDADLLLNG